MARLSLAVLGSASVTLDGQPVTSFAYQKARALLVYLAVEAHRAHARDTLVGLLWPELPNAAARTNLRQALADLRQAIGDPDAAPPFLLSTRESIQFNPASDYDLDAASFTTLLTSCETHAHRALARCRSCAARMQQALALYRGDFLAGFAAIDSAPFEEWQLRQREQLHQQALDALACLTDYHERRGEYDQAGRYAQRQLALDPWREEAHRQLMRLLVCGHQRSAALAQYETCRRILARELGVEPEAGCVWRPRPLIRSSPNRRPQPPQRCSRSLSHSLPRSPGWRATHQGHQQGSAGSPATRKSQHWPLKGSARRRLQTG